MTHNNKIIGRLAFAYLAVGALAGCGGVTLSYVLHLIQHIAFGYSLDAVLGHTSFLEGVRQSSLVRRTCAVVLGGLVAGVGWWWIRNRMAPMVSINQAMKMPSTGMPVCTTLAHTLLQVITVALGSPLGREVAPREVGALSGSLFGRWLHFSERERQLLLACGAGAGLAAVYNVPLAGALFTLEGMLMSFEWAMIIPALGTASLAAFIASLGLGHTPQYHIIDLPSPALLWVWAVLAGPIIGVVAYGFSRATAYLQAHAPRDICLPVYCLLTFTTLAGLACVYPELLGNGKPIVQECLDGHLVPHTLIALLIFKSLVVLASLKSGANGGVLTPALALGALCGGLLGEGWTQMIDPSLPLGIYALIGAPAFLGTSMKMPLTAVVLFMELTRFDHAFLAPVIIAVMGALCAQRLIVQALAQREVPV